MFFWITGIFDYDSPLPLNVLARWADSWCFEFLMHFSAFPRHSSNICSEWHHMQSGNILQTHGQSTIQIDFPHMLVSFAFCKSCCSQSLVALVFHVSILKLLVWILSSSIVRRKLQATPKIDDSNFAISVKSLLIITRSITFLLFQLFVDDYALIVHQIWDTSLLFSFTNPGPCPAVLLLPFTYSCCFPGGVFLLKIMRWWTAKEYHCRQNTNFMFFCFPNNYLLHSYTFCLPHRSPHRKQRRQLFYWKQKRFSKSKVL